MQALIPGTARTLGAARAALAAELARRPLIPDAGAGAAAQAPTRDVATAELVAALAKPLDASDIASRAEADDELARLRALVAREEGGGGEHGVVAEATPDRAKSFEQRQPGKHLQHGHRRLADAHCLRRVRG